MKHCIFIILLGSFLTGLCAPVILKNEKISLSIDPDTGGFTVKDLRTNEQWEQQIKNGFRIINVQSGSRTQMKGQLEASGMKLDIIIEMDKTAPEFSVTLSGAPDLSLPRQLAYPHAFLPHSDDLFILPEHEGVGIPVSNFGIMDKKFPNEHIAAPTYNRLYRFYSGHDLSMTFWGYAGKKSSCMSIVDTPDDAGLRVSTVDGRLAGGIEWESSRGTWSYDRTIRYVFFTDGGYNAICKRYRDYAFKAGLLKTLKEKSVANPNVMQFATTALFWSFSPDTSVLVSAFLNSGLDKISVTAPQFTPGEVQMMKDAGVLSGIYDCYRSVMPDEFLPKIFRSDPCDVRDAYPDNVILMQNGVPFDYGWPKNGYDGKVFRTLDVCDTKQLDYCKARMAQTLEFRPMTIRFFDTITAFPWTECYDPAHPTTRSQVRDARISVLRYTAEECKMVTGSEAGHIYVMPYAAYFEGMHHSRFFYYQISGHPLFVYDEADKMLEEHFKLMKVEHQYRLPLLQLVAHDCIVSHTRWNTPNNKIHDNIWWDHSDRMNILYGVPPMYMFINEPVYFWEKYKDRYLQSYENTVVKTLSRIAGEEMLSHEFLTKDKNVQRTTFANGIQITVNFGSEPFEQSGAPAIAPGGFSVKE